MSRQFSAGYKTTHRYALSYAGLDEWRDVGIFKHLKMKVVDMDKYGEAGIRLLWVAGPKGLKSKDVRRALADTLSYSHCRHEHDCCGCRSFHVLDVRRTKAREWVVRQLMTTNC